MLLQEFSYFPSSAFQLKLRSAVRDRVFEGLKSATKQKVLNERYSTEEKERKRLCHQRILQYNDVFPEFDSCVLTGR